MTSTAPARFPHVPLVNVMWGLTFGPGGLFNRFFHRQPEPDVLWIPPTNMPAFTANADYEEKDTDPIRLNPGDEVIAGPADQTWPGWVWATRPGGAGGYVPDEILRPLGGGRFAATEAFDPAVLTIRRGDRLESLRQIHGWHWCRNEAGAEGWVAGYLLRPA